MMSLELKLSLWNIVNQTLNAPVLAISLLLFRGRQHKRLHQPTALFFLANLESDLRERPYDLLQTAFGKKN